jgi:hypothetical protein
MGFAALYESGYGTNATNPHVRSNDRFRRQERTRYAQVEFFAS